MIGTNVLSVTVRDVTGNMSTQSVGFTKGSVSGTCLAYDANGNLTNMTRGGVTNAYEWDVANHLTRVTSNGVEVLRCWYDGAGRRIAKQEVVDGETRKVQYVYDGMTVMAVLDESGKLLEYYTRGLGVGGDVGTIVAATHTADSWTSGTFYVLNNHRGDVTAVRSGSITVANYDYSAFGEARSATGAYSSRFRLNSKEYDASVGLYYYGFRYYAPDQGRWISMDPIGIAGGLNRYAFCADSPVNVGDALGLLAGGTLGYLGGGAGQDYDPESIAFTLGGVNSITAGPDSVLRRPGMWDAVGDAGLIVGSAVAAAGTVYALEAAWPVVAVAGSRAYDAVQNLGYRLTASQPMALVDWMAVYYPQLPPARATVAELWRAMTPYASQIAYGIAPGPGGPFANRGEAKSWMIGWGMGQVYEALHSNCWPDR